MPIAANSVPRVDVVVKQHLPACPAKDKGSKYIRCGCPKHLYWYAGGKPNRESAGTTDYQVAQRIAFEKQASFVAKADGDPEHVTLSAAVDLYLSSKTATGYKDKSLGKLELIFRGRLETYFTQRGVVYLKDIKRADLEAWRATWTGAASTKGKVQGRVIGFFDWAVKNEMLDRNPALGLERIKGARDAAPTMPLTDEQFQAVLAAVNALTHRQDDARDRLRAVVLLQRWTGLAIRDALTVERSRFRKTASGWYQIFLRRAKTGVDVYGSLSPDVAAEVLGVKPASDRYLFWGGKESVDSLLSLYGVAYRRAGQVAGLKDEHGQALDFHSHMLRDTFAVWCFNQGMATEDVAALLGHRNITVTQQHYSPWIRSRQERLASIVEAAYTAWVSRTTSAQVEPPGPRAASAA